MPPTAQSSNTTADAKPPATTVDGMDDEKQRREFEYQQQLSSYQIRRFVDKVMNSGVVAPS